MAKETKAPATSIEETTVPNDETVESISEETSEDSDITPAEIDLLDNAGVKESEEDEDAILSGALLDDVDDEGEPLNESIDVAGDDLDVPGSESDDEDEMIGEEDEENNSFSTRKQGDADAGN